MKVVFIEKDSVGEAWANAVLEVFFFGEKIRTEYRHLSLAKVRKYGATSFTFFDAI